VTCGQVSVDCFAIFCASALANSWASVAVNTDCWRGGGGRTRRCRCAVWDWRSGRPASVERHAEQRSCTIPLSIGCRGSPKGKVQVSVEGRAVGSCVGLCITGVGYRWELGDNVAKLVHNLVRPLLRRQRPRSPWREPA
jgi:hypothetical protein